MKKFIGVLAAISLVAAISVSVFALVLLQQNIGGATYQAYAEATPLSAPNPTETPKSYEVYVNEKHVDTYPTFEEALLFAKSNDKAFIKEKNRSAWLWDNYPPFIAYYSTTGYEEFATFGEAAAFARSLPDSYIFHRKDNNLIWTATETLPESFIIDGVPHVMQLPELPRGCEVTSLSMILKFYGADTDKMRLAGEVTKDSSPLETVNGVTHWGNPADGFVGDMKDFSKDGFGVYHRPIYELLQKYFPRNAMDLTGAGFDDVLLFVSRGDPVWVIINSTYSPLPDTSFTVWHSKTGEVRTTYYEHSVVITGYDKDFVYIHDPLGRVSKTDRASFAAAWRQMGSQAVAISD